MKKLFTLLSFITISFASFSQIVVVGTGFDNYANTSATAPAGWYLSWHSLSPASSYTSAASSGVSVPSYKMGLDSVTVITPMYQNADTLSFWCKGNSVADTNELHIYHSTDSSSWTLFVNRDSLTNFITTLKYGLPASSGWIKFVYRKLAGGNLAFDDVNIIAYPNIYADFIYDDICFGDSVCFMDSSFSNNGAINYWEWDFDDGTVDSVANPCHYFDSAGVYDVMLIVANAGGDTDTVINTVTVYPTPVAGFSSTLTGNVVAFTDTSTGGASYLWDFGDGNFSAQQNPNPYSYWTTGTYTICQTVTNADSCDDTFCQTVNITAVGIHDLNAASSISIFPTVSESGIFTLHNSSLLLKAEVYNAIGEKMKNIQGEIKLLNLSDLPAGIYFVKLHSGDASITKKIVISK